MREVRDPIHGFIGRTELEQEIIDAPAFQRLRLIRQLAMASLVYPGAVHTRFDHSLGAMHVAGRIARSVRLNDEDVRLIRLAALLHDIGHGPFSHVSEPVLETFTKRENLPEGQKTQIHEALTAAIIQLDSSIAPLLSERDREKIAGILSGTFGHSVMNDIVSGPLDADKQDYLLRDSYFCGVRYGLYDLDRLSECLIGHEDSEDRYLAITQDGVHALEQFVLAKYYMTTQVYRHKIRLITDGMIQRALILGISKDRIEWLKRLYAYDGSKEYLDEYKNWTDERLIHEVLSNRTPDGFMKNLFLRLMARQLHKRIASFRVSEFRDPLVRNALADLAASDREAIESDVGKAFSLEPEFVIVNSFDIKSVREQARNSEASVSVLTPEGPVDFEAESALFRSIDEAVKEKYIEVYAPVTYQDEKEKRRKQKDYKQEIRRILIEFTKSSQAAKGEPKDET